MKKKAIISTVCAAGVYLILPDAELTKLQELLILGIAFWVAFEVQRDLENLRCWCVTKFRREQKRRIRERRKKFATYRVG